MDDQLLEVVGLYSSIHIGKIQVSLSEALRLGQAKEIKVRGSGHAAGDHMITLSMLLKVM